MVIVGLGAAVVVIIGGVGAGVILAMRMDLGEPTVSAQTSSAEASAPTATLEMPAIEPTAIEDTGAVETQAAGPGQEVRDGNFAFVVGDVQTVEAVAHPDDPEVFKQAQGEYVIVRMTVTNVSAEPQPFYVSFSTLSDGTTVYKSDDEAWLYLGNTVPDLSPGESLETSVVFDVPVGTRVESIELHGDPLSRGVTVGL
jgi:succinate dehydrogenase/fumarate reductase flavoprotein subunit